MSRGLLLALFYHGIELAESVPNSGSLRNCGFGRVRTFAKDIHEGFRQPVAVCIGYFPNGMGKIFTMCRLRRRRKNCGEPFVQHLFRTSVRRGILMRTQSHAEFAYASVSNTLSQEHLLPREKVHRVLHVSPAGSV